MEAFAVWLMGNEPLQFTCTSAGLSRAHALDGEGPDLVTRS